MSNCSIYCLLLLKTSSMSCLEGWEQLALNILLYNLPEQLEEPVKLRNLPIWTKPTGPICLVSQTLYSDSHLWWDIYLIYSQCNMLPKPRWSHLIPASYISGAETTQGRSRQSGIRSRPSRLCVWTVSLPCHLCHDPPAWSRVIPFQCFFNQLPLQNGQPPFLF